jgi:hypothetical protein
MIAKTPQEKAMLESIDEWAAKTAEVRADCIVYIQTYIRDYGERENEDEIVLNLYDEDEGYTLTCSYDGGGDHPEYASELYTTIWAITLKDNEVFLSTEEEYYSIDRVPTDEVITIAENLLDRKPKRHK